MSKRYLPGRTLPGSKTRSVLPFESPRTVACPTVAAARTPIRCCGCRPGLERRARTLRRWKALPVISDSARLVRRICPPPSPNDPSSSSIGMLMLRGGAGREKSSRPDGVCCGRRPAPILGGGEAVRQKTSNRGRLAQELDSVLCPTLGDQDCFHGVVPGDNSLDDLAEQLVRQRDAVCLLVVDELWGASRQDGLGEPGEECLLVPHGEEEQTDGVGELPHPPELSHRRAEDRIRLPGAEG